MKYGLSEKQLREITDILSAYDEITEAILFGSRAMDTYKEASDVDIALKGEKVSHRLAAKIKTRLEDETYLPFFFDVIAYTDITNEALKKHIDQKGKQIYRKDMCQWKKIPIDEYIGINPTTFLPKGAIAKKVSMANIEPFTKKINAYDENTFRSGVKFKNGDTLMARITPSLENGKTSFVDILNVDEVGFGSTEFIVLRAKAGKTDSHFVYYLATSPELRDIAIKSMTGSSGRQRVQSDVIKRYPFLFPPLPEQKAIASVLSSLDDKIDLLHRQNKTLESMAETLFRQWFVEEAKEEWEEKKLGDFVDILSGYAFKSATFTEAGKYSLITIKAVQNGYLEISGASKISDIPEKMPAHCSLKKGDILLSLTGSVGRCCLVDRERLILNQRVAKLIPKEVQNWSFIYTMFRRENMKRFLQEMSKGSAQANLSPVEMNNIKINIPPPCLIKQFSEVATPLIKKALYNKYQIHTLQNLRSALLPKLISGALRVLLK